MFRHIDKHNSYKITVINITTDWGVFHLCEGTTNNFSFFHLSNSIVVAYCYNIELLIFYTTYNTHITLHYTTSPHYNNFVAFDVVFLTKTVPILPGEKKLFILVGLSSEQGKIR